MQLGCQACIYPLHVLDHCFIQKSLIVFVWQFTCCRRLLCYLAFSDKHMNFIMMAKSVVVSWQFISRRSQKFYHVKSFFFKSYCVLLGYIAYQLISCLHNALKFLPLIISTFCHPQRPRTSSCAPINVFNCCLSLLFLF